MDLSRHLLRRGYSSDVLTLNRNFNGSDTLPDHENIGGIHVVRIPYWGAKRIFVAPGVLRHVGEYDILHVHNIDFFSDFLILTKPYHRKPVVVSTHGGYFHTSRLAQIKKLYFQSVTPFLLRRADKVIADSFHDRDLFAPSIPKIKLIENGVDYSHIADVHKNIEPGLLLYIGRLAYNKRVDNLIRCLAVVRKTLPHARLVLVGGDFDNIYDQLVDLAHSLGVADAVTFTGQVSDAELAGWFGRAHVFVSASEYEAFGISVLEAMSTGTVPVVNPLKPFQDFIQHGKSGFLTDFTQPDKAAQVIVGLLMAQRESLAVLGKRAQEAAKRYDWEHVVGKFIEVYQSCVNKKDTANNF